MENKTYIATVKRGPGGTSSIHLRDLKPYEGKVIVFEIKEVRETIVTQRPKQGVVITETRPTVALQEKATVI
jgi:hypothetical protein